jgi:hypothetical protein
MEQIMIKNKKIIEAVKSIPTIADKEKWVLTLDREEGSLYYSPESIADNAQLYQVTDEYSLYLDKDFNPKGVMIEYYNGNFVKHHLFFERLSSEIFKGTAKIKMVDPTKSKEGKAVFLRAMLETALIKGAEVSLIPV